MSRRRRRNPRSLCPICEFDFPAHAKDCPRKVGARARTTCASCGHALPGHFPDCVAWTGWGGDEPQGYRGELEWDQPWPTRRNPPRDWPPMRGTQQQPYRRGNPKAGVGYSLLPPSVRRSFPTLGATSHLRPEQIPVIAKFFTPYSSWSWFAIEGEDQDGDFVMFGFVVGFEEELGQFLLQELQSLRGPGGMPGVERDLYFGPATLADVMAGRKR